MNEFFLLATPDYDLGVFQGTRASIRVIAQAEANRLRKAVRMRDPTTDRVIAVLRPQA
jgi:hypothetical protein